MNLFNYPDSYAVKHKNIEILSNSRSGGFFTAISDYVLNKNGVVYGCIIDDSLNIKHIRASNVEMRDLMRGSKYVQSDMGSKLLDVKKDLDNNLLVLFTGTSCQIAGLRSFLQKEYKNLICLDIVCHGVPSKKVFDDYVIYIEQKYQGKVISVDFRNKKDFGWTAHVETLYLETKDGKIKKINSEIFKILFYRHNILRPSCYNCPYKSKVHPGDITIADLWGVENVAPEFNDDKGVSLVLINTELGRQLFNEIKDNILYKEINLENCLQEPLVKSFPVPSTRKQFWNDYYENSFDLIIKKYADGSIKTKFKKKLSILKHKLIH